MKKVMFWDDERNQGNSIIVTLKYGWRFSDDTLSPTHVMGFDTIKDAKQAIRYAQKCNCIECKNN
jgi:hypothetical protein